MKETISNGRGTTAVILLFTEDVGFGNRISKRLRETGYPAVLHDPDHAESICRRLDFSGLISG